MIKRCTLICSLLGQSITKCLKSSTFPPLHSTHLSSSTIPHLYLPSNNLISTKASTSQSDVFHMNPHTSLAPSCTTRATFSYRFSQFCFSIFFSIKLLLTDSSSLSSLINTFSATSCTFSFQATLFLFCYYQLHHSSWFS